MSSNFGLIVSAKRALSNEGRRPVGLSTWPRTMGFTLNPRKIFAVALALQPIHLYGVTGLSA